MQEEEWRDVTGFDGYQVSSLGRVRSRRLSPGGLGWKALKPAKAKRGGYWKVTLRADDGTTKTRLVHRLVLEAFVGPCRGRKRCGLHNDDDVNNNRRDNLRWGTPKDNSDDCVRNGRRPKGEAHTRARLTTEQVEEILRLRDRWVPGKEIAARFGISLGYVYTLASRRTWAHLPEPPPAPRAKEPVLALDREMDTYRRKLPALLAREGDWVVIRGDEVAGVWGTFTDALHAGYDRYGLEQFLCKEIKAVERPVRV